jgi:hypothetical protein
MHHRGVLHLTGIVVSTGSTQGDWVCLMVSRAPVVLSSCPNFDFLKVDLWYSSPCLIGWTSVCLEARDRGTSHSVC